jgi:predicted HD phosphohydrolase
MQSRTDILLLLHERGRLAYEGEGVTQLQHAWQCGRLASRARAAPALQLAAWLHDIGHLLAGLPGTPTLDAIDDGHEILGGRLLDKLFGPAVAMPVTLHVAAKRCMVATRPGYARQLSADSARSLQLQGGPMGAQECAAFLALPHARQALRLRTWDDMAKRPALRPAHDSIALAELAALMEAVA